MTPRAVVLLSGGLDSTTTLALARSQGFEVHALTFRYGQRHQVELEAARAVAAHLGVARHWILPLELRALGGSALTTEAEVPKGRSEAERAAGIPVTYVPARNTIFLSLALALAEVVDARDIFIGISAVDSSGYPDCRPEFLAAFQRLAHLATRAAVEGGRPVTLQAPLLHLSKAQIIQRGLALGVDYGLTRSCYDPTVSGAACGACDACLLRLRGFAECGLRDPAPYCQEPPPPQGQ
ncbi:MAG: 7-cyano-7-deazaguanine synthase QueC [Myxococcales bacterium]|nr:7-cyano-7-deazaguanine synthase QueC [Myxococcota bacterium]MDW8283418.1 7-cyano-7-deazaguanine synthase QueC [Myxococcales bacterium]